MKNLQKGFIVPVLVAIIALLVIGGGVYVYESKKAEVPAVVETGTQPVNQNQQQTNTQTPPVTTQQNTTNNKPVSVAPSNQTILNILVTNWKKIGPSILPGFPSPSQAFYGNPYIIQFIGNNRIVISYQDDFNPLFAVLSYDSSREQFSYLDGLRSSPFEVNEALWNTWRKKYGDIFFVPQTYEFSSTRTGDVVYSSDWKLITKNPFSSSSVNVSSATITVLSPNGGENWQVGSTQTIKWSGGQNPLEVMLETYDEGELIVKGWVATNVSPSTGQYVWKVGDLFAKDSGAKIYLNTSSAKYFIRVNDFKTGNLDRSNELFTITN